MVFSGFYPLDAEDYERTRTLPTVPLVAVSNDR